MVTASSVNVPLNEVSLRPLRGNTSITSGLLIACASGFGSVFVSRTRHLFSSLVAWPARLVCTTGVRATFSSLMPATLDTCTEAWELRCANVEASSWAHTTTVLVKTPSFTAGETSLVRMIGSMA